MPTYDYTCTKCGHVFELVQPMSAKAITECPKELCAKSRWGKGLVKRGIGGGAGLIFKGSGFYITDYRSEGYKQAAKKDVPPSAPAKSSDSGGSSTSTPASPPSKSGSGGSGGKQPSKSS